MDQALINLFIYGLSVAMVVAIVWLIYFEIRLKRFWRGHKGADLEEIISNIGHELIRLHKETGKLEARQFEMNNRLRKSIQKVHTLRFNPFRDQGGNQSFATCMLNEEGDGVVISSLYSRDKVSVYAKPIKALSSEYELSIEEKEALKAASSEKPTIE